MRKTSTGDPARKKGPPLNILFLTQILPYPPDAGPRVKTWHVLRYLVESGHSVTLLTFLRGEETPHVPAVQALCERVITVPIARSRLRDLYYLARSQVTGRPFLIDRDRLPEMYAAVGAALAQGSYDVIHADQLGMAQYALFGREKARGRRPRILFDSHNAVWMIVDRMAENALPLVRPFLRLEARRLRRYEAGLVRSFDQTAAVTDIDRLALADDETGAAGIATIPIAVDTRTLRPRMAPPGSMKILTLGTLSYPPNADGVRWFLNEVYPRVRGAVPGAGLTIVGKQPPPDFVEAAAADPSVRVTGYVPDLQPYMDEAALVVVPVRAGGGMRVRILEAFARGMPVVTTTVGLEGIAAEPGRDVLVADTPEAFAGAVRQVLESEELQMRLARRGRRLAEARYDWRIVLRQMDAVYERLGQE